ncbi:YdiU family protein [Pseudomaricurvus sp. HS19]|uniref:protein adenylyltransferase SelO n=1 Tax=Pseudomaricurvus sp. HS19 TaxID=2692626 RepID=UPI0013718A8D|nr:YdiU family protein [Pseudomaricurvus sp. HS19]MYM61833.1 YdiU family protein [Pseudomaricurvus sp. HS19]
MSQAVHIPFDNLYVTLDERLFSHRHPTPVKQPGLIRVNDPLARLLGIDPQALQSAEGVNILAGNAVAEGSQPIATVYAGHQFGSWNPQLGDGRAILLGEVIGSDGLRYDVQLKGAGETPYSRMGDGRSPLGPVLREYIVSEAMYALGVPTTRALAAVTTGERVARDDIFPGAILTRVARSHIRVGTFQFFGAREDWEAVRTLADHVIERHYPHISGSTAPYLELLQTVVERQAQLIAQWQSIGFIHGVMNTDNMLVGGETVDFGPCAFMESYDPRTVFSSIDRQGRYAYANQPGIAHWNLAWLAQSLLPLLHPDEKTALELAGQALNVFPDLYNQHYTRLMCKKLGFEEPGEEPRALMIEFLTLLQQESLDFTLSFRVLADYLGSEEPAAGSVGELYPLPFTLNDWLGRWRDELGVASMDSNQLQTLRQQLQSTNPVFLPRNHRVEEAIQAGNRGDFGPFHKLVDLLTKPFDFDPDHSEYIFPAKPEEAVTRTFCGT